MKKKIITALIVIAVIAALVVTANVLVSSFDISLFLKNLHGG
jgi:hypothetical protein